MSNSVNPFINPVKVEDKRVAFSESRDYAVIKSGVQATYTPVPTQSYSNANIQGDVRPNNAETAIDRSFLIQVQFDVTFTGTAGANGLLLAPGLYDAPRSYPLARITTNMNVKINTTNVSQPNYQCIDFLTRCNVTDDQLRYDLSLMPSMQDFYQEYDWPYTHSLGIANDPLQTIGQNSYQQTRGGFPYQVLSNTSTTAVVRFTTIEPMWLLPTLLPGQESSALINLTSLFVNINLSGNAARLWSHSNGNGQAGTITSISYNISSPPQFLCNYITPSPDEKIPDTISYNYSSVTVNNFDNTTTTAGNGTGIITTNSQQLSFIPRRFVIFVRRTEQTQDVTSSDTFARIDKITMRFDNRNLLSESTSQQLYTLSRDAGLNMNWAQWNGYTGSMVILDVGKSVQLSSIGEAAGISSTKNLQFQINFTNLSDQAIVYSAWVMIMSDGLLTIQKGLGYLQDSVLSVKDVLDAKEEDKPGVEYEKSTDAFGGNIMGSVKSFARNLNKFARKHHVVSNVASAADLVGVPHASKVAAVSRALGYGGKSVSKNMLLGYRE